MPALVFLSRDGERERSLAIIVKLCFFRKCGTREEVRLANENEEELNPAYFYRFKTEEEMKRINYIVFMYAKHSFSLFRQFLCFIVYAVPTHYKHNSRYNTSVGFFRGQSEQVSIIVWWMRSGRATKLPEVFLTSA